MSMQPQTEIDPVSKFKALVPRLKDLLSKLMEAAATVFYQNSVNDNCSLKSELSTDRVDKCLEEFFAICDQMELLLKLALECNKHSTDSAKFTPMTVQVTGQKSQPNQEIVSFPQYLSVVRGQIRSAKEIHDLLLDACQRLSDPASLPMMVPPVTQQQSTTQPTQPQSQQQAQPVAPI